MFTYRLYSTRPFLNPDEAKESGSYIGELTNIDDVAEELIKTFPAWNDSDILQVIRGENIKNKNWEIYTVGLWRPFNKEQRDLINGKS